MIQPFCRYLGQCALCATMVMAMLGGFVAGCSGSKSPALRCTIEPLDSTDSVLYIIYEGRDSVWRDSLPLPLGEPLELRPDTAGLLALFLAHGTRYEAVYRYTLRDGAWRLEPQMGGGLRPDTLDSAGIYQLSGQDARGKYRDMYGLLGKGRVAIIFSDLALETHSRAERDSLSARYPKDSLELVYMMLTPSDTAALSRLRRDTLERRADAVFSDTLGVVSRLRAIYGIERAPAPHIFIVDSLGRVSAYTPD